VNRVGQKRINFLHSYIDNLSMREVLDLIQEAIQQNNQLHHVVLNAGKIVAMEKDLKLRESVNESDLINADGQAVVWASNILGKRIKERIAGIDLMEELVRLAYERSYKIYFFGAEEEIL